PRALTELLIACAKLGVEPVVLDPARTTPDLVAALSRADVLISDAARADLARTAPARVARLAAEDLPYHRDARSLKPARKGRGEPFASVLSRIPLKVHETALVGSPLFHTSGRTALHLAIGLRSTVVLTSRTDPAGALAAVERHRCTALFAGPAVLKGAVALDPALRASFDLSTLRIAVGQGGALPAGFAPEFMDVFGEILYSVYGTALSIATPGELLDRPDTAGRPVGAVKVVREDGRPALPNMPGVIVADSAPVGVGHLDPDGRLFVAEGVTVRDWLRRQVDRLAVTRELPGLV
ncbi:AMP-binding protein, partial [Actinocorallia lasiicapitis]